MRRRRRRSAQISTRGSPSTSNTRATRPSRSSATISRRRRGTGPSSASGTRRRASSRPAADDWHPAGRRALVCGDDRDAAKLLERACELSSGDDRWALQVRAELGRALAGAGELERAGSIFANGATPPRAEGTGAGAARRARRPERSCTDGGELPDDRARRLLPSARCPFSRPRKTSGGSHEAGFSSTGRGFEPDDTSRPSKRRNASWSTRSGQATRVSPSGRSVRSPWRRSGVRCPSPKRSSAATSSSSGRQARGWSRRSRCASAAVYAR